MLTQKKFLFQFQDGAIKGSAGSGTAPSGGGFQFQDGAIKGEHELLGTNRSRKFQFQDGAIKGPIPNLSHGFFMDFNSKMVRLRGTKKFQMR